MKIFYADYLIYGPNLEVLEKVYLYISDGHFIKISENSPKNSVKEVFEDSVLVPGFINLHIHIGDSFAKDYAYGLNVKEAVGTSNSVKKKLLESVDFDKFKEGIKNAVKEMLSAGITTFVDFREGGVRGIIWLKKALEGEKIRAVILGRGTNGDWEEVLAISDGFGIGNINKLDDDKLISLWNSANKMGKLFGFHASETNEVRFESIKKFGTSDLFRGISLIKPSFVVHATHANLSEIKLIAEKRIPIILCPRSNAYFGSGIPPIKQFFENNIILGLGTDNMMGNSPDLFKEFDFLVRQARVQSYTPNPKDVLSMVTKNAAKILNLPIGIIEEGFRADFFIFDLNKPNVAGMEDIIKAIVLRGNTENVVATYIDGELVYEK